MGMVDLDVLAISLMAAWYVWTIYEVVVCTKKRGWRGLFHLGERP